VLLYANMLGDLAVEGYDCQNDPRYAADKCGCWISGYQSCTGTAFCKTCTKDYPKPLGTGTSQWTVRARPGVSGPRRAALGTRGGGAPGSGRAAQRARRRPLAPTLPPRARRPTSPIAAGRRPRSAPTPWPPRSSPTPAASPASCSTATTPSRTRRAPRPLALPAAPPWLLLARRRRGPQAAWTNLLPSHPSQNLNAATYSDAYKQLFYNIKMAVRGQGGPQTCGRGRPRPQPAARHRFPARAPAHGLQFSPPSPHKRVAARRRSWASWGAPTTASTAWSLRRCGRLGLIGSIDPSAGPRSCLLGA
jgi:hypothetical protein